jgi:hypothetical protein
MMFEGLKVGDKVWFQSAARFSVANCEIQVTKVGRKWAYWGNGLHSVQRFDLKTGCVDGGDYVSVDRVFPSRKDAEEEKAKRRKWSALRTGLPYLPGADVSAGDIDKAAALLGIKLQ